MVTSHRNYVVTLLILMAFGHCREPYEFKTIGQVGLLVVDGNIIDQPGPYFLKLSSTNIPGQSPAPLTDAIVTISDELNNSEAYQEIASGKYELKGSTVYGRSGGIYAIHINLPDGRQFESIPELMPTHSKAVDSIFIKVSRQKVITNGGVELNYWMVNTYLNTRLPENTLGYYRWAVSEVWNIFSEPEICYISEPISKFNLIVVKSSEYSQATLRTLLLLSRGVDFSFHGRHYFNVTQYSMNEGAYEYWEQVEKLITKRGSIFDIPPSIIGGNIRNIDNPDELVFGYFEASGTKVTRSFIDRGAIPTYVETCDPYSPDFNPSYVNRLCFLCPALPGATLVEPDWFW